jgi:hypothetical protein
LENPSHKRPLKHFGDDGHKTLSQTSVGECELFQKRFMSIEGDNTLLISGYGCVLLRTMFMFSDDWFWPLGLMMQESG